MHPTATARPGGKAPGRRAHVAICTARPNTTADQRQPGIDRVEHQAQRPGDRVGSVGSEPAE